MSFKSIVEMFKYDSSEQPFMEEAMRLAKAEELMSEIEARTQALQERLEKHGTHDQEDHGGKNKRPRPRPTIPAKPKRPKPDVPLPRNPNSPSPEEQARERLEQEIEEKKKKDEAARRKLEEQMRQVKKEQGIRAREN